MKNNDNNSEHSDVFTRKSPWWNLLSNIIMNHNN